MYTVNIVASKRQWKEFLDVPALVYRGQRHAVRQPVYEVRRLLDRESNPSLHGRRLILLTVQRGAQVIGRCSVLLPGEGQHGEALFGFFESVNDREAAYRLFATASDLCAQHGVRALHGPFNPDTSGLTGVHLDNCSQSNVLGEPCSLPYYPGLLEHAGFAIEQRGRTWRSLTLREDVAALRASLPKRETGYALRSYSLAELRKGLGDLAVVFNEAFRNNWSRDDLTTDQYAFTAASYIPAVLDRSLTLAYRGDVPIGAMVFLADCNPALKLSYRLPHPLTTYWQRQYAKYSRTLVGFAIGLLPRYQNSGAVLELLRHFTSIARNYDAMYTTWITQGNQGSERICARLGLQPWRSMGVFRKEW